MILKTTATCKRAIGSNLISEWFQGFFLFFAQRCCRFRFCFGWQLDLRSHGNWHFRLVGHLRVVQNDLTLAHFKLVDDLIFSVELKKWFFKCLRDSCKKDQSGCGTIGTFQLSSIFRTELRPPNFSLKLQNEVVFSRWKSQRFSFHLRKENDACFHWLKLT